MSARTTAPLPIDPLAAVTGGVYRDALVDVARRDGSRQCEGMTVARTPHFEVTESAGRLQVVHAVANHGINADVAGMLHEELFAPGWLRGGVLLERLVTGVVLTVDPDPLTSWELFYRNTLDEIDQRLTEPRGPRSHLGDFAPVYGHAQELVRGSSALELGCSLGFLSLRLAGAGLRVEASDLNPGNIRLLSEVAPRLGLQVSTRLTDAARYPGPGRVADSVLAVHLLEHVDAETGDRILAEALRLATERVVIAVPLEDAPDAAWGHIRAFTLDSLADLGRGTGQPFEVHEFHGGWLVIDLS